MKLLRKLYPLLIGCIVVIACNSEEKKREKVEVVQDTSITPTTSFNNLFLDSNKINDFLEKHPEFSQYKEQFSDFYKQRNYEYAWFDTSGLAEQASNFMNLLSTSIIEFKDSSLYNKKLQNQFASYINDTIKHSKAALLQTELNLTGQFFRYASKTYRGSDIDATELGWFIPKKKIDLTALLDSVIVNKGRKEDQYLPLSRQYKKLQDALSKYYELQKQGNWDSIPAPKKSYSKGDSSAAIAMIKKRLLLLGDYTAQDTTGSFDSSLVTAVKAYQNRLGLQPDGAVGKGTLSELNTPLQERIKQILINLERVRWMPAENDSSNYIMVNIPEYKLHVYENNQLQFDMNVIVGKEGKSTVIFTGNIKYVVFSPYWNVPSSIVKEEIVPAMKKDPNYLEKKNMEITGNSNGLPVVRQKPGGDNALGNVKFLFPNSFDIYLHDTPNRSLFSQTQRNFSHGCIRIQDPKKMALYLLQNQAAYTPEKVDSLMHLDKEKWVTLEDPERVFIGYFTAWVDADGKLNFRKDIYGHDQKMADKMFTQQ